MGFLDEVVIWARSGDGGRGCVSFRREKFIPKGGPDGGDGGNGGSIIVRATDRLFTLTKYASSKYFKARNGEPGRSKNQSGKNGTDLLFEVPLGTIIEDLDTGATVDRFVADQLIPFAAISEGWTAYRIPRMSDHIEARLWLVEELLGAKTEVKDNLVRIRGIGYTR